MNGVLIGVTFGIAIAVVCLVVYSALVVSSRQDLIARRVREENRFVRASINPYNSSGRFAFETSEELTDEDFLESEDEDNYF